MKKIGIITISRTNNYGAELQAYALQKKLQMLGYEAKIIDYLYYKHKKYKYTKGAAPDLGLGKCKKIKQFVLFRIVSPFLDNVFSLFYRPLRTRLRNFEHFHTNNVCFSQQYRSILELNNANHDYDVFIVGSDQVWSPATGTSLSPYFLEFATKGKLKISYASSFGVSSIDKRHYPLFKKYLNNLDSISVRENAGVNLVKDITGREAFRVLDPTLLLSKDEWLTIVEKTQKLPFKYLVIYQLYESDTIINLAYHIKSKLNLEIVLIAKRAFMNKKYKGITLIVDAGPSEFVELFSKASFVVTNSFHGTAFSINFNVPFFTVLNSNKVNNSRMIDFLDLNGLSERIIWEATGCDTVMDSQLNNDFVDSNSILEKERVLSVNFLLDNIK